jgi:GT2 family glycosyltransferase
VELHDLRDLPVTIRTRTSRYRLWDPEDLLNGPIGCNMAFRRGVLSALGGFDADFGAGTALPSHEDTELLFRALQAGCKVCYVPDVLVFHNHGRRTEADLDALTKRYVLGRGAMYAKHILRRNGAMLRMAYWELRRETKRAIVGMIAPRFRNRSAAAVYYLVAGGLRLVRIRCEQAFTRLRGG